VLITPRRDRGVEPLPAPVGTDPVGGEFPGGDLENREPAPLSDGCTRDPWGDQSPHCLSERARKWTVSPVTLLKRGSIHAVGTGGRWLTCVMYQIVIRSKMPPGTVRVFCSAVDENRDLRTRWGGNCWAEVSGASEGTS